MAELSMDRQQRLYRERLSRGLAELNAEIARTEQWVKLAQEQERRVYDQRLSELYAMRTNARDQLYRVEHETELDWEMFSADIIEAWQNLQNALGQNSDKQNT